MVNLTINGKAVQAAEGTTILKAARQAGISIPTLCYLEDLNEIGACRVCVVEIKGTEKLASACNTAVAEGMEIFTNSPKVRQARRTNVELILAQHNCNCAYCVRSGNCELQALANSLGIISLPFEGEKAEFRWDTSFPLIRDASKCIKCMRCVQVCDKVQGLSIWDAAGTGSRTTVAVKGGKKITEVDCSLCGQCITHCPVGALYARDDTQKVLNALADPEVITLFQVAPAIRGAFGRDLGLDVAQATSEKLASAIRALGADYVFDTNFAADLTIMEEGSEFLKRLPALRESGLPMFTSCCPGWVRFIKSQYPDMVQQLSSAKSPHQMFGALLKDHFAAKLNVDPSRLFVVSIMPCVAKKSEPELPGMTDEAGNKNVDAVLTTRELVRMLRADRIDVASLEDGVFDSPFGTATGAAVIFGVTGGVMEAALRSAYYLATGTNPDADAFKEIRIEKGWKEAEFEINGAKLQVAVVSGLGNVRKLMDAIRRGEVHYDFVEVMACPGGCSGGGGQPITPEGSRGKLIGGYLRDLDSKAALRYSHENPDIQKLYQEYLGEPLSHKSHELLHVEHIVK